MGRASIREGSTVRSDGKITLAVAHLAGCDLSDRERWEGVVLSDPERGYAIDPLGSFAPG